jgi:pyruvate dehydrogenase (quinone)
VPRMTVADQFIEVLRQVGVDRIYGVVGDSLNPIVDAIRRTDGIDWIHVRNEEAAAFAAGAQAMLSGQLAVCAGSCSPGNTHLIQGLYDAQRNGAPVLAIASHIKSTEIGTGYFQETHPQKLFEECSVSAEQGDGARPVEGVGEALHLLGGGQELRAADGQGGPAGGMGGPLGGDVPGNHQHRHSAPGQRGGDRRPQHAGHLFRAADQVAGAHDEVMALAGKVHSPIGHTLRGKEWIQYDNPYDVGMSGLLGYGACYEACHEADLLLMLGTDFPYDNFLPQSHTIQVDRDATRIGRRTSLDLAVHGDVGATLRAVLPLVEQ